VSTETKILYRLLSALTVAAFATTSTWAQDVPRRSSVPPVATNPSVPVSAPSQTSFPGVALPVSALKNSTLELALNEARMLELPRAASNIIVGNEEVADVHIDPDHPTKAFVIAKEVGSTNIFFLDAGGRRSGRSTFVSLMTVADFKRRFQHFFRKRTSGFRCSETIFSSPAQCDLPMP